MLKPADIKIAAKGLENMLPTEDTFGSALKWAEKCITAPAELRVPQTLLNCRVAKKVARHLFDDSQYEIVAACCSYAAYATLEMEVPTHYTAPGRKVPSTCLTEHADLLHDMFEKTSHGPDSSWKFTHLLIGTALLRNSWKIFPAYLLGACEIEELQVPEVSMKAYRLQGKSNLNKEHYVPKIVRIAAKQLSSGFISKKTGEAFTDLKSYTNWAGYE